MTRIGERGDPYLTSKFWIEIQGIDQASFAECSAPQVETEVMEYQEGGLNEYVHKLPGRSKVSNVTLKRGITESPELWDWYRDVLQGKVERKNVSIVVYDLEGEEVLRWTFIDAYPVKWTGPTFNADANAVCVETLELAHRGMALS